MQKGKPRNSRPHNRPYLIETRRGLRKRLTPAEAALWRCLQNSKLDGRKFRRQHSIGNYILDFYCPAERLAVELDGEVHNGHIAEHFDGIRTRFLNDIGVKVLRIENHFVFDETEYVLARIRSSFGWWERSHLAGDRSDSIELPPRHPDKKHRDATPPIQGGEL